MDNKLDITTKQVHDLDAQIKTKKGSTQLFASLNLSSISIIILLLGYILWYDYDLRLTEANKNTQITANLYAAHTHETILKLEKMLFAMEQAITLSKLNVNQVFNKTLHQYLLETKSNYNYLMDILIINPAGNITQWTGEGVPPNVKDRSYVQFHLDKANTNIHVSEPMLSKVHNGQWFFSISMPVYTKAGELQYIAVAIIDVDYFQEHFQKKKFIDDTSLMLLHKSGIIITRNPDHNKFVGIKVDIPSKMQNLIDTEYGNLEVLSPFDNINRVVGYYHIKKYGIIASVAIPKTKVLAQWYFHMAFSSILLLIIVITMFYSTFQITSSQNKMRDQRKKLYQMANTDELTGLINRRQIFTLIKQEVVRAKRHQKNFSFIMMDIDHFKSINDNYGHKAGDNALKHIAAILTDTCRDGDFPCRYGGEEFLIVLPETDITQAENLAERLRKVLDESVFQYNKRNIHLSASFGVSSYIPTEHDDLAEVSIKLADNALYKAKNMGRNTVCT